MSPLSVIGLGETELGPWGIRSEKTESIQIMANTILPRIGKAKIEEDGVLGGKTCQAIRDIISSGKFSGWDLPSACTGGGAASQAAPSSPAPLPSSTFSAPTTASTGKKLLVAGLGVLLVVGGYSLWKKR